MKAKFTHDCDRCQFLGHYFGHDVYVCNGGGNTLMGMGSIIARYGDDGPDYASQPLCVLKSSLTGGGNIGGTDNDGKSWSMPYTEWVFSDRSIPSTSAMILALALKGMEA